MTVCTIISVNTSIFRISGCHTHESKINSGSVNTFPVQSGLCPLCSVFGILFLQCCIRLPVRYINSVDQFIIRIVRFVIIGCAGIITGRRKRRIQKSTRIRRCFFQGCPIPENRCILFYQCIQIRL